MRSRFFWVVLFLTLTAPRAQAQQTHWLLYTPPANAYRSGVSSSEVYSFNGFNASVQIYPFPPLSGDIQQMFQASLLRDWIDPVHREENVGGPPTFQRLDIAGAQYALAASFAENIVGLPRPHMRMVIVAGGEAAIVDASAGTAQSWQRAVPALNAMAATLRVEASRAPPPLTQAAGRDIAGLYTETKPKYMATMVNVIGSGYYTVALHYDLFSADGRVYRAYDRLEVPGGNIASFDFDEGRRRDPTNSGRHTVDGGKRIIRMEGLARESLTTDVPGTGS